ncbi:hypothetical protein Syn6312_2865 [Synechococcus sp. PCC 6312]|nr:DUF5615 family PIN-like protein [Synechococcus sp. PCC 6312]AFY61929.1 hypothetical protein Syn6312_2865 [Synechococcus sp. PCC 6312]
MFSFYVNENLSSIIVKELRHLGYDVLTSYEAGNANQKVPDEQVLSLATEQQRSVITHNRDDFLKLHRSGFSHAGIIVLKEDRERLKQVFVLHQYLISQESLQGRFIRVLRQNQQGLSEAQFIIKEY